MTDFKIKIIVERPFSNDIKGRQFDISLDLGDNKKNSEMLLNEIETYLDKLLNEKYGGHRINNTEIVKK